MAQLVALKGRGVFHDLFEHAILSPFQILKAATQ